jgi:hypothetical protein
MRYPVLPKITYIKDQSTPREAAAIGHSSRYAARDL